MKKYTHLLLIFFCALSINAFPQKIKEGSRYERLYIQSDKEEYIAGELIWLKVITTNEMGTPSSLSKIAYIELLDESNPVEQIKIELTNAKGEGWIRLPQSLSTGIYRLTGYTRYMRNENDDIFFSKEIIILNPVDIVNKKNDTSTGHKKTNSRSFSNDFTSISTDKKEYNKREKVEISVKGLPQDIYSLSIAVAGEQFAAISNNMDINKWKENMIKKRNNLSNPTYLPEYEGHIIEAQLINKETGLPEPASGVAPIVSFPGEEIRFFSGKMDEVGNVFFPTKNINGKKELATTLINYSDKSYRIDLKSPFIQHENYNQNTNIIKNIDLTPYKERAHYTSLQNTFNKDSLNKFEHQIPYFNLKPERSYKLDNYTRFLTMGEVISEFVTYVYFKNIGGRKFIVLFQNDVGITHGNTLVLVDGIPIFDHETIYNYDPLLVETIDVYYDKFVFGGLQFNGIVALTTYKRDYPNLKLDNSSQIYDYVEVQNKRYFYMPIYDSEAKLKSRIPDFRHTLYWNPDVDTKNKNECDLTVYTSDMAGKYTITIEGLTKAGSSFVAKQYIEVK